MIRIFHESKKLSKGVFGCQFTTKQFRQELIVFDEGKCFWWYPDAHFKSHANESLVFHFEFDRMLLNFTVYFLHHPSRSNGRVITSRSLCHRTITISTQLDDNTPIIVKNGVENSHLIDFHNRRCAEETIAKFSRQVHVLDDNKRNKHPFKRLNGAREFMWYSSIFAIYPHCNNKWWLVRSDHLIMGFPIFFFIIRLVEWTLADEDTQIMAMTRFYRKVEIMTGAATPGEQQILLAEEEKKCIKAIVSPSQTCSDSTLFVPERLFRTNVWRIHNNNVGRGGRHNYLLVLLAIFLSPNKFPALDDMFTHSIGE